MNKWGVRNQKLNAGRRARVDLKARAESEIALSGRLFHSEQDDIKKEFWNDEVLAKGMVTGWEWWIRGFGWTRGWKYGMDGMIDPFLIIRWQSWAFCLRRRERRELQLREAMSSQEGVVHDLIQNLAANDCTDSRLLIRMAVWGSQTQFLPWKFPTIL